MRRIKKTVFLDRDGTINVDTNYVNSPQQLQLIPGAGKAISLLNRNKYQVIVVSNQSGVARGYLTLRTLGSIHRKLRLLLKKENARLDAIYYCPLHPDQKPSCRKPEVGMARKAQKDLGVDLKNSYMIGDSLTDVEFGNNIGAKTILVLTGKANGKEPWIKKHKIDCVAEDLMGAVLWILNDTAQ
jgi:histidinol-phosphate phosphatase family protein